LSNKIAQQFRDSWTPFFQIMEEGVNFPEQTQRVKLKTFSMKARRTFKLVSKIPNGNNICGLWVCGANMLDKAQYWRWEMKCTG